MSAIAAEIGRDGVEIQSVHDAIEIGIARKRVGHDDRRPGDRLTPETPDSQSRRLGNAERGLFGSSRRRQHPRPTTT